MNFKAAPSSLLSLIRNQIGHLRQLAHHFRFIFVHVWIITWREGSV
jgi:hypothetical protein